MSILITSDIQAEWGNLDRCEQAWNEVLNICKKEKIKTIAYLGDGKQAYNPVDVRVIKWWQNAIRRAIKRGIQVIWNLGNHDRVGQSNDSDNWLPILRRAGAVTYDIPGIKDLGWCRLFILPFSGVLQTKRNIRKLCKEMPDRKKDILLFHCDIKGASYNQLGGKSDASLSKSDVFYGRFRYCIGGHIHFPQKLGENIFYVGSPFCHDFGEVNQRKRYLVLGASGEIRSIDSRIPRWYDPSIQNFRRCMPDSWKDARIRISVECDASQDYGRAIERARKDAERKYKGAIISVVPKFKDTSELDIRGIRAEDSDERKLRSYVREIQRQDSKKRLHIKTNVALEYMLEKLSHFSTGLRTGSKVEFIYAKAKNFLPFEKVKTDFTKKGITVIQGINKDRNDKSNGAAKTSLMQILPVSMFGRTFKGQKSDKWSNRWRASEVARAEVLLRDYKKRKIKIVRGRHPPLLRMSINNKDVSSGMKSNDKEGTQAQIEQLTGFTWQTLANAVYIDRSIADAFLSGTNKQRTDVLSRFQNLERFERALELVKKDERKNREALLASGEDLLSVRSSIFECKESIESLNELSKVQIDNAYAEYAKRRKALKLWQANAKLFNKLERKANKIKHKYDKANNKLRESEKQVAVINSDINKLEESGIKWHKLKHKGKCPTCLQKVSLGWIRVKDIEIKDKYNSTKNTLDVQRNKLTRLRRKVQLLDGEYTEIQHKLGSLDTERRTLEAAKKTARSQWMELSSDKHASQNIIIKAKNKLKVLLKEKQSLKHKIKKHNKLNKLYEFAMEAFSRNGISAFLNRELCPTLNKSAEYYSALFSDSEIQVRFKMEGGEFVSEVINPKGGSDIEDQSTGERALAGLIASFALREVAPKCNVLMLDEPGEGLDQQTARQFARALQKLTKRFGSIWVASHNIHILSELSGERIITVQKKDGISKVIDYA